MHKLYTTYFAKLKKINFEKPTALLIIMRMPPIAFLKYEGAIHAPELSPKSEMLLNYKRDKDFDSFTESFNKQIEDNKETVEAIKNIIECLEDKDGNDICLICCEKDMNECHRSILANYIYKVSGITSEEL